MNLFHGTSINTTHGLKKSTCFTANIAIALDYMKKKSGNIVYLVQCDETLIMRYDAFDDCYVSLIEIPNDCLIKLTITEFKEELK